MCSSKWENPFLFLNPMKHGNHTINFIIIVIISLSFAHQLPTKYKKYFFNNEIKSPFL